MRSMLWHKQQIQRMQQWGIHTLRHLMSLQTHPPTLLQSFANTQRNLVRLLREVGSYYNMRRRLVLRLKLPRIRLLCHRWDLTPESTPL